VSITLDLMELDGKATPEAAATGIFRQNPGVVAPVPLEEIASAAGIGEIKPLSSDGFEGMLISNPEKSEGVVFVNQNRPRPRQRFTIGHELGHFLLPWHRNLQGDSLLFECTAEDMRTRGNAAPGSRKDWEIQANEFASEILMPRRLFKTGMKRKDEPDLLHVQDLSRQFETSVEATALRYVALSDYPIAMVFAKGKQVRHAWRAAELPYFLDEKGSFSPTLLRACRRAARIPWQSSIRSRATGGSMRIEVPILLTKYSSRRSSSETAIASSCCT